MVQPVKNVDGDAHGGRGEHAVRPDDLRLAAGGAVVRDLAAYLLLGQEVHTEHARAARRRQDDLAAHRWRVARVDVHADVDVGHQQAAAACLDLLALAEGIDASHHQGAPVQRLRPVLPPAGVGLDVRPRVNLQNPPPRRLDFQRAGRDVRLGQRHGPVQVGLVAVVGVVQHEVLDAEMGQLRRDDRAAAAEAVDADPGGLDGALSRLAEEALSGVSFAHASLLFGKN